MLKFMNSKERKRMFLYFEERFCIPRQAFDDYHFLENKEKIWICSKEMPGIDFRNLRVEGIGMLFGRKGINIKPTTNMVQLFGKAVGKNILTLNNEQKEQFIQGLDILNLKANVEPGYVMVKHNNDFLGCALYKEEYLKNQVPKQRRILKNPN